MAPFFINTLKRFKKMKTFNRFLEESYSAKYNLVEAGGNRRNALVQAATSLGKFQQGDYVGGGLDAAQAALSNRRVQNALQNIAARQGTRLAGKFASKLIPGLNIASAGYDAYQKYRQGDTLGALMSAGEAIPGVGLGFAAANIARDAYGAFNDGSQQSNKPQSGAAQAATPPKPQQRPQQLPQNQPANQRIPQGSRSTGIDPSRSVLQQRNINQPLSRQLVSQQTGAGGRVAANTAYQSTLGGVRGTTTYGTGGQQMFRANLGNQGVNRVASGQAQAGREYGATLGGVKGTVTYDPRGNRTFQAFRQASSQPMAQRTGAGGTVSTNRAYQSRLGGAAATTTYGAGGQQMIRANLGNQGVNRVASGQAQAGRGYGATLGGVKGTVTYDPQGNRRFQALRQPASQAITQRAGAGGTVSTNRAYQSRLGGAAATTTYGPGGQRMIRANLGRSNKPTPQPTNRTFSATLGGVKGTVTYDRSGNRQFKALQRPR